MTDDSYGRDSDDAHIVSSYDEELADLQRLVADMGAMAAHQVESAVNALMQGDVGIARNIIHRDRRMNELDMEGKERVVALFAARAPLAKDLRLVISLHNVVDILERVSDAAKAISEIVVHLFEEERLPPTPELMRDVTHMGTLAVSMLREALTALANQDVDLAVVTVQHDVDMNAEFRSALRRLATFLLEDMRNLSHSIDMVFVLKSLERVSDYARNICEHLIYAVKGKDVRYIHPDHLSGGYLDA
ncbi:MAG: phosphate signaling complex protein PhoU [Pseudomonadota bacterium]